MRNQVRVAMKKLALNLHLLKKKVGALHGMRELDMVGPKLQRQQLILINPSTHQKKPPIQKPHPKALKVQERNKDALSDEYC